MKKIILGIVAIAMLAIPSIASADVVRCDASVPVKTTVTTATFTMNQPANGYNQWDNVWKHDFTVNVNADNSFTGTGIQTGWDANYPLPNGYTAAWEIIGQFNADRTTVTFKATRPIDGLVLNVVNETMGDDVATIATDLMYQGSPLVTPQPVEEKVTTPVFTSATTTTPGTESVKNHGQYVKSMGGGKEAAQACAGMPTNSTQGKK